MITEGGFSMWVVLFMLLAMIWFNAFISVLIDRFPKRDKSFFDVYTKLIKGWFMDTVEFVCILLYMYATVYCLASYNKIEVPMVVGVDTVLFISLIGVVLAAIGLLLLAIYNYNNVNMSFCSYLFMLLSCMSFIFVSVYVATKRDSSPHGIKDGRPYWVDDRSGAEDILFLDRKNDM